MPNDFSKKKGRPKKTRFLKDDRTKDLVSTNYGVIEKRGKILTTSINVSDDFNKRHDNVLKDIKNLECSEQFRLLNFKETSYKDSQNKKQPMYEITKDGFVFLVMGFTGKKAMEFKEGYIKQFNKMEEFIREKQTEEWQESRKQSKICNRKMTDAIQIFVEYAKDNGSSKPNMYYLHFQKLINKALSIKSNERDFIGQQELNGQAFVLNFLQKEIINGIKKKLSYKEVYLQCKEKVEYFVSCFGLKLK